LTPSEGPAVASFVEPMHCLAVSKLPEGKEWQYELKLEGFRTLAAKHPGQQNHADPMLFALAVLD
jgi:ATP-dependent DNA ligase